MTVRIIRQSEVPGLLPMGECIEAMEEVFRSLGRGEAVLPLRSALRLPDGSGLLGLMPAWLARPESLGLKVVTVMPGHHGTPHDSHQGAVLLFETAHGSLQAVIDATSITAIRTAAASAVATRALAREDAGDLALLGTGVQATTHLEAMRAVRRLRRVRAWSRSPLRARAFAERESARRGLRVEAAPSAREAVRGADIVCTVTSAREPVLAGAWLSEGAHVNAVGACFAASRELDTEAVRRSRLFVDRRESALHEAGDILVPLREGAIEESHIAGELGALLLGRVPGRRSPGEITLFKSLGLAVQDLAAAHRVRERAEATGAGIVVDLGGRREA